MNIKALHDLIHQLTPNEHTLIRYALKGSKENGENKYLQLFEFVVGQKKLVSRGAIALEMYNAPPDTRINKLISRLWEKVLDIITSENFLRKNGRLSEPGLMRIQARKKMLQGSILLFLNGITYSHNLLIEESIHEAEKTESNMMLIDLYRIKKSNALFHENVKEYDFCSRQVIYYEKCHAVEQKILFHYNEMNKHQEYGNAKSPEKNLDYLKRVLSELKKEHKYINTVYAKKLLGMFQLGCAYLEGDYILAKRILKQLHRKLSNSFMAGGRSHVVATIESELSICEVFLGNYEQAIKHCEKALSLLWANNKFNYYISLVGLFQAVFYAKKFDRAEEILATLLSDQNSRSGFRAAKPFYLHACINFKKEEYKQALKIVTKPMSLNKDKTGYDIAIRVLRILCLIELNRFDEASNHIENLRKHVNRNYKITYTSERDKLITKVLVLMQKRGFAGKSNKAETELMKKLSDSSGKYRWSPRIPELIRFHEWYTERKTN